MATPDDIYNRKLATQAKTPANVAEKANASATTPTTYNERVVQAIKTGTQSKVDVNANLPFAKPTATWTKAGTVQTLQGPIDVDANGKAADGSVPIEITAPASDPKIIKPKLLSTYTDPETGDIIDVYDDETEKIRKKGTKIIDATAAAEALSAKGLAGKKSAFDIIRKTMAENGLESLADAAIDAIMNEDSDAGRLLALRSSPAYKIRFSANAKRIANGFAAIDEATYLDLEDKYQSILQNYGMPEKYYKRGELGVQQYLADAIAKNIDAVTFEERVIEGQKLTKANKQTIDAAKQFFPTLTDGDFLDYVLNPENAVEDIKRKVTAVEIGGAQLGAGLQATLAGAETLAANNVTGAQYQAKASAIAGESKRGGQLAAIYKQDPYTQQTAERVALNIPGSVDALKQTKKIIGLERATFGGKSGITSGALARDRAGGY